MMVATLGSELIEAARGLARDPAYCCPKCRKPVVLHARAGGRVIPHFKHKADSQCPHGRGETKEHRVVKGLLRDHYRSKGYEVKIEHLIGTRRADVFVSELGAFEVEFSPKEAHEFIAKCRDYERSAIRSLWIIQQRNVSTVNLAIDKTVVVSVSRVLDVLLSKKKPRGAKPAFFSCDENGVAIFRGKLSPIMLYKEEFDGNGGYEYPSRRYMELHITEIIRLERLPRFPGAGAQRAPAVANSTAALSQAA
jgi:hypothetical protein